MAARMTEDPPHVCTVRPDVPKVLADLVMRCLERDPDDRLAFEIDRLHRSCRRLIWLNPLLRFDGFEAKAKGIRAILPHVDEFRPIHNLESVAELCRALSTHSVRAGDPKDWLRKAA
jgi:uncharacterized protein with von Willebrand factor type A (vWA) domain